MPNVIRSADDFVAGNADMFFFAFGAAKIREVDVTVGGIRVLEIDDKGMPAARKIMPWGYLTRRHARADVRRRREADENLQLRQRLITHAKVPDDFVYKMLDTMEQHKDDLVAVQPVLREFSGRSPTSNMAACPIIRAH